ncbi:Response regulator (CheY-like protein receiver domain and DNA-binding HTH protein) [Candidatus Zixiibacteriota bacterium]|nr:Response regulator (CheY-like protein receiver domain and DNA-binding HTH protein) [candidate division Zixibacteria bacterium]
MAISQKIGTAKILVIDDEPQITEIVEAFLSNAGHQVFVNNVANEGLKRAKQVKPDIILLDIMMPGTDGYGVCNDLKNDPATANIPVVFLTGKDRNDDMGRSFKVGGDMFIKKPFSCERLLEIVNIILMSTGKK